MLIRSLRHLALLVVLPGCVFISAVDRQSVLDADSDGFGASVDCDDSNPEAHPDASEVCNGRDDDCDGDVDEGLMPDEDADGFGDAARQAESCAVGWISEGGDCDDTDPTVAPGLLERCDGRDNGCDPKWSPESELGAVTWFPAESDAEPVDLSAEFGGGELGIPYRHTVDSGGTLAICRNDGEYFASVYVSTDQDVLITGVPIPLASDGDDDLAYPTLNGFKAAGNTTISVDGSDSSFTLTKLIITGGVSPSLSAGGGLSLRGVRDALIEDVVFDGNQSLNDQGGAGAHFLGVTDAALNRVVFDGNQSRSVESIAVGGGLLLRSSYVTCTECTFFENHATDNGGGLYVDKNSSADLIRSVMHKNESNEDGGGLYVEDGGASNLRDTVFTANHSGFGGAVYTRGVVRCSASGDDGSPKPQFIDNTAVARAAVVAVLADGSIDADGCEVSGNEVQDQTGPFAGRFNDIDISKDAAESDDIFFNVTGDSWACDLTSGCTGDVEADPKN